MLHARSVRRQRQLTRGHHCDGDDPGAVDGGPIREYRTVLGPGSEANAMRQHLEDSAVGVHEEAGCEGIPRYSRVVGLLR